MNDGFIYTRSEEDPRGYSIGWNLKTLIEKGLQGKTPPETLNQLLEQIILLASASGKEWSGSITINSFDNHILPFLEMEKPSKQGFIDQIQGFLQKLNETKTNVIISLDLIPRPELESSEKAQVILDAANGVLAEEYGKWMQGGKFNPSITINLYLETSWDSPLLDKWVELSYLYGQPVYQNFITGTIKPETLRPRNEKPDHEALHLRLGGVSGNSEDQSITGYACINLARLGSEAQDEQHFFSLLDEQVEKASEVLESQRETIESRLMEGKMPITEQFIENLDWSFSVITLAGMNEALESLIDAPLGHVAGKAVTYKTLEYLLRKLEEIQYRTGHLYSIESYPSEKPGAELLKEYETKKAFLTPATELKSSHGDDLWDVLEHQKKYHSMYTGGTLQQIHLKHGLIYNPGLKLLLRRTIDNFGYNYLAVTPVFSLCAEHGYILGDEAQCPVCGKDTETYTRIDNKITALSGLPEPLKEAYRRRVYYDVKNK